MTRTQWIVFGFMTMVWVGAALGFWLFTGRNLTILFLAINAFAVLGATYIAVVNVLHSLRSRREDLDFRRVELKLRKQELAMQRAQLDQAQAEMEFQKTENAYDFCRRWNDAILVQAREFIRKVSQGRHGYSAEDILREVREDVSLETAVVNLQNFFEAIHNSLVFRRVNEDLLFLAFWDPYQTFHSAFESYLTFSDPDYSIENRALRNLHARWNALEKSGKPQKLARLLVELGD